MPDMSERSARATISGLLGSYHPADLIKFVDDPDPSTSSIDHGDQRSLARVVESFGDETKDLVRDVAEARGIDDTTKQETLAIGTDTRAGEREFREAAKRQRRTRQEKQGTNRPPGHMDLETAAGTRRLDQWGDQDDAADVDDDRDADDGADWRDDPAIETRAEWATTVPEAINGWEYDEYGNGLRWRGIDGEIQPERIGVHRGRVWYENPNMRGNHSYSIYRSAEFDPGEYEDPRAALVDEAVAFMQRHAPGEFVNRDPHYEPGAVDKVPEGWHLERYTRHTGRVKIMWDRDDDLARVVAVGHPAGTNISLSAHLGPSGDRQLLDVEEDLGVVCPPDCSVTVAVERLRRMAETIDEAHGKDGLVAGKTGYEGVADYEVGGDGDTDDDGAADVDEEVIEQRKESIRKVWPDLRGLAVDRLATHVGDHVDVRRSTPARLRKIEGVGPVALRKLLGDAGDDRENLTEGTVTVQDIVDRHAAAQRRQERNPAAEFDEGDRIRHKDGRTGTVVGESEGGFAGVKVDWDPGFEGGSTVSPASLEKVPDDDDERHESAMEWRIQKLADAIEGQAPSGAETTIISELAGWYASGVDRDEAIDGIETAARRGGHATLAREPGELVLEAMGRKGLDWTAPDRSCDVVRTDLESAVGAVDRWHGDVVKGLIREAAAMGCIDDDPETMRRIANAYGELQYQGMTPDDYLDVVEEVFEADNGWEQAFEAEEGTDRPRFVGEWDRVDDDPLAYEGGDWRVAVRETASGTWNARLTNLESGEWESLQLYYGRSANFDKGQTERRVVEFIREHDVDEVADEYPDLVPDAYTQGPQYDVPGPEAPIRWDGAVRAIREEYGDGYQDRIELGAELGRYADEHDLPKPSELGSEGVLQPLIRYQDVSPGDAVLQIERAAGRNAGDVVTVITKYGMDLDGGDESPLADRRESGEITYVHPWDEPDHWADEGWTAGDVEQVTGGEIDGELADLVSEYLSRPGDIIKWDENDAIGWTELDGIGEDRANKLRHIAPQLKAAGYSERDTATASAGPPEDWEPPE